MMRSSYDKGTIVNPGLLSSNLLEDVKAFLKITDTEDDAEITRYIDSAIAKAEGIMYRSIPITRFVNTREVFVYPLYLRRAGGLSVDSVKVLQNGVQVTLVENKDYVVILSGQFIKLCDIDTVYDCSCKAIEITFTAGYGDNASDIPADIKQAINLMVGDMWNNRGDCGCNDKGIINQVNMFLKAHIAYDLGDPV